MIWGYPHFRKCPFIAVFSHCLWRQKQVLLAQKQLQTLIVAVAASWNSGLNPGIPGTQLSQQPINIQLIQHTFGRALTWQVLCLFISFCCMSRFLAVLVFLRTTWQMTINWHRKIHVVKGMVAIWPAGSREATGARSQPKPWTVELCSLKTLVANLANQIIFEPVFFDPQLILQTGLLNHLEGFSCRSSRTLPLLFTSVGFAGNVLMHLWKDGFRTVSVFQATHTPKISQNT